MTPCGSGDVLNALPNAHVHALPHVHDRDRSAHLLINPSITTTITTTIIIMSTTMTSTITSLGQFQHLSSRSTSTSSSDNSSSTMTSVVLPLVLCVGLGLGSMCATNGMLHCGVVSNYHIPTLAHGGDIM